MPRKPKVPSPSKPDTKAKKGRTTRANAEGAKPSEVRGTVGVQFSERLADEICAWIADGNSLRAFCRQPNTPDVVSVYRWLAKNEDFRHQYARAREDQADSHADEIIEIADTEDDPNKARIRIDARKWVASKLKPKKYGETTQKVEIGKPGEFAELEDLSDADLADIARGSGGRAVAQTNGATRPAGIH